MRLSSVLYMLAIVGAIAGFAAQPVIADLICGMMLSAAKTGVLRNNEVKKKEREL